MVKSYIFERNQYAMKNKFSVFLVALFAIHSVSAQYTDVINTNRPGVSEGAYAVGRDVIQLETGFSYGKEEHSLLNTETTGFGIDYTLRYGLFFERLELNLTGEYHANNITYTAYTPEIEQKISNFKRNTLGAKYLIYDPNIKRELRGPNLYSWRANNKFQWSDLIPSIALYAGANFDLDENNPYLPKDNPKVSPRVVLSTQNNWKGGWVFVTNFIADRFTTDYPTYSYILTLTHAINHQFSFFVENEGIKSDFYADQLIRGGGAMLINNDFHVDVSLTYSFKDTPSILYGRVGMAYRFDLHKKDEFIEDKDPRTKQERKAEQKAKKRKSKTQQIEL